MSDFAFSSPRPARRPSLTPMIDVVFLLLVFFMLAARFGQDATIVLTPPGAHMDAEWVGPPRLVTLRANDVMLNGVPLTLSALIETLRPLMAEPTDPIVLRAAEDVPLQALIDLLDTLSAAGMSGAVLVE